jgi:hypothetical protein
VKEYQIVDFFLGSALKDEVCTACCTACRTAQRGVQFWRLHALAPRPRITRRAACEGRQNVRLLLFFPR